NGWMKQGSYWYYCKDGWAYSGTTFVIDGATYAFDDNCRMQTGWYKYRFINGNYQWCYFDSNGKGHNGWVKDSKYWYYCEDGRTVVGTVYLIGDIHYGFDTEGRMATGWYKLVEGEDTSWYYFDSDGKGHTGLAENSKHTYYCSNGEIVTNQDVTVDGVTYHCDENGYAVPV
ncbi:MAG: hypothetical protein Q4D71_06760, partial [Oscillospiraceae bacterium]|nr:hypothetical protein [Oscillospiraceae bacterium]